MGFAGILLVLGAVLGGYLMEGGEIGVLIQPAEIVIIMGAALGSVLISTPLKVVIQILQSLTKVLTGATISKAQYIELHTLLYELFQMARKDGQLALEPHIGHLAPAARDAAEPALQRLVRFAWLLDSFGDLGNRQQVEDAYSAFTLAAADVTTAFGGVQ